MNFWETYPFGDDRDGTQNANRRSPHSADGRAQGSTDAGARHCDQGGAQGEGCDFYERLGTFSDKSEEQLMSELMSAVNRMKAEGSFDPASLERLYLTASPFLSEGQRERMRRIIDLLIK